MKYTLYYSVCYSLQLLRKLVTALCSCKLFISASSVPWPTQCCLAAAQDSALQQGTIIIISLYSSTHCEVTTW